MARWTDLAEWRGPTPNQGPEQVEVRGLVIHIAEGYYDGTINYQKGKGVSVSSHFVVGDGAKSQGRDGAIAQVVDTDVTAWTQRAGNGHWLSVECAGFTPHPLTAAQVESLAQLLARVHREYGVPLQLAVNPDGRGLGHHSMGTSGHSVPTDTWTGPAWGHEDCPGPAIIAQKPTILARAIQIAGGGTDVQFTDKLTAYGVDVSLGGVLATIYKRLPTDLAGLKGLIQQAIAAASADPALPEVPAMGDAQVQALADRVAAAIHVPTTAEVADAVNDDAAARLVG